MKGTNIVQALIAVMLCLSGTGRATVRYVHPDSNLHSVQAGLNSCNTGDTVLVGAGVYWENLIWPSTQGIDLVSESGPSETIIDGNSSGSVIVIITGVDSTTVIDGFTLRNGTGTPDPWGWISGGGIYCMFSSPTIIGNVIMENTSTYYGDGGGIYCLYSSPIISGNTFTENFSAWYGGAICCAYYCSPLITDNIITENISTAQGGGICTGGGCSATIIGNTITENTSGKQGGGIIIAHGSSATITGNTVSENTNMERCGGGIVVAYNCFVTITNNTIKENTAHNNGGGIDYSYDCTGVINSNCITENTSLEASGGGIFIGWGSSVAITDNVIAENNAQYGGGITCYDNTSTTIKGNTITDNTGEMCGGGVYLCRDCSVTVDSCTISENNGDGVHCAENCSPLIHYNNITENTGYGLCNVDSGTIVDAENNWWGAASGPGGEGPGGGDEVSTWISFVPWLTDLLDLGHDGGGPQVAGSVDNAESFCLYQNCPNPLKHSTVIRYYLPVTTHTKLVIYDLAGRRVTTLVDGHQTAGHYNINWDGRDTSGRQLANGAYFYRIEAEDYIATRKLLVVR